MPIADESHGGLKRYAVFAFVQDDNPGNQNSPALRFPMSPNASSLEASTKITHTELFHIKRLKSLEKNVSYPYVDVTFFSSYLGVEEMKSLLEPSDCVNLHDHTITLQKGCFEEVQLVDPKRDMIMTPIDVDDILTERLMGKGVTSQNKVPASKSTSDLDDDMYKRTRGYVIIAFKTMEHMYKRDFVSSWKTWTGVRYICMQLPRQLGLRRIAFYRQLTTTSDFTYVLVVEVTNLLLYSAQTLNLMDGIKLRLCGYTGLFREMDFQVDLATASAHNMPTSYKPPDRPFDTPRINVSRYDSNGGTKTGVGPDELAEIFKKQTEIATRRRNEQELADKLEEQRKTKIFKLFSRQDSVPNYAPPPPPPNLGIPNTIEEHNSGQHWNSKFLAAPKASPESPDMSPPQTPPPTKRLPPPPVAEKPSKYKIADAMKQRQAAADLPAVHGQPLDKRLATNGNAVAQVQVVQPTVRSAAKEFYEPLETTVKPQVVHSSQVRPPGLFAVKVIQPQQQPQQFTIVQQHFALPTKSEPHRLPPPYGIYPPYSPLPPEVKSTFRFYSNK